MSLFTLLTLLVLLAAAASYLNYKFFRLPSTIGVMVVALAASGVLLLMGSTAQGVREWAAGLLRQIDFNALVLHGMLAFLLFAGALHLDLGDLGREKWAIALLAGVGTVVSTFLVGGAMYCVLGACGAGLPLVDCLLFGALISPTDPVAVLAIMQKVGAPRRLEMQMAGESLFNDGVGVVIFLTILEVATGGTTPGAAQVALLLLKEVGGGLLVGLAGGSVGYLLLKRADEYQVEILVTLALAMGVYSLADALHVSAPIAAVVAGLFIGNPGRALAMSPRTREHLDTFWELIDSILNAVLFMLLGMGLLVLPVTWNYVLVGLAAVPVTVLVRGGTVAAIVLPLRRALNFLPGTARVLTWGALRGGISVAMALSLPEENGRNVLLVTTYVVVVFSIAVQGLTIGRVIRRVTTRGAGSHG